MDALSRSLPALLAVVVLLAGCGEPEPEPIPHLDLILLRGTVVDGTGAPGRVEDVGVLDGRIAAMGDLSEATADERIDVTGLTVAPGFIDMHSHAELTEDYGRDARPFLAQGITTVVMGVDGGGTHEVGARLQSWADEGIGVNALTYVGHGHVRREVMGMDDRAPTPDELDAMRALVRRGMEEGALGLSSGLFYTPGFYATTDEVIELGLVASEWEDAIYDTHDRDLGATYQGVGYDASVAEGIQIGAESGLRVIFSHFNPQGATNRGRADVGIALIEDARLRGLEVAAAQHPYTATQSNLRAYALPRWAAAGGPDAIARRFADRDTSRILQRQIVESLAMRGGPDKILFADADPRLNGKTLAQVVAEWGSSVPRTVERILRENGNATVMNLELYDAENTRLLARQPWMMTCTDGRTPAEGQTVTHPRVYGAFPQKMRMYALDSDDISVAFAVRSMSGLAADFLRLEDRGRLAPGSWADIAVIDLLTYRSSATYTDPHRYADGVRHLLVNGTFAIRDGEFIDARAGMALRNGGTPVSPAASATP
ncbi:MAG: amidohydrolase family protein [Gemmatimonadetes bacterium]|nr:amidohydrolase family protein [Gemmatimonadota bacterium]